MTTEAGIVVQLYRKWLGSNQHDATAGFRGRRHGWKRPVLPHHFAWANVNLRRGNVNLPGGNADLPGGNADLPGGNVDLPRGNVDLPPGNVDLPCGNVDLPRGNADLPWSILNLSWGRSTLPQGRFILLDARRWTATGSALYSGPVVKKPWTSTPRALAAFAMIRSAVATN